MNYLIIDDEPQARKLLQAYMQNIGNYTLVKLCENAMEAYEALQTQKVDLMFLDIKMPIISGTDFLRSLKNPPLVIFTTAYHKFAMEGFELNVVDYLLKPIALPRLLQALEKAQSRWQPDKTSIAANEVKHLFIKIENKLVKVTLADILLIEGMQNYTKLHLPDKILITAYTMKALAEMLPAGQFLRAHRSFIVPIATINAINGNTIETTYQNIPIGISYKNEIIKYANNK
ncbi:MAG: response regulator transcription factor [Bacteroidota bacterium]